MNATPEQVKSKIRFMFNMIKQSNPDCYTDAWLAMYNHIADGDILKSQREIKWALQEAMTFIKPELEAAE
jgi:hypothetical protein